MADQNTCSDLEIINHPFPQFEELLNIQLQLQEKIMPGFGEGIFNESLADKAKFLIANKHAMEEEYGEMLNALGGMHDGIGSAAWKWWKKDNKEKASTMTLEDLSERDLIELKMEVVDKFHFFLNVMLKVGMTGGELYSYFQAKNRENINRQNNGY
jgi:hypothetical protein